MCEIEAAGQRDLLLQILPIDVKAARRNQQTRIRHLHLGADLVAPERVGLELRDVRDGQPRQRTERRKLACAPPARKPLDGGGIDHGIARSPGRRGPPSGRCPVWLIVLRAARRRPEIHEAVGRVIRSLLEPVLTGADGQIEFVEELVIELAENRGVLLQMAGLFWSRSDRSAKGRDRIVAGGRRQSLGIGRRNVELAYACRE